MAWTIEPAWRIHDPSGLIDWLIDRWVDRSAENGPLRIVFVPIMLVDMGLKSIVMGRPFIKAKLACFAHLRWQSMDRPNERSRYNVGHSRMSRFGSC